MSEYLFFFICPQIRIESFLKDGNLLPKTIKPSPQCRLLKIRLTNTDLSAHLQLCVSINQYCLVFSGNVEEQADTACVGHTANNPEPHRRWEARVI